MWTRWPLLVLAFLALGCDPPPTTAVDSAASAPSSENAPAAQSADEEHEPDFDISCECRTGPVPAPPGKSPITSRAVRVRPDGTLVRTTTYLEPPPAEVTSKIDEDTHDRLRQLASKVFIKKASAGEAEQPVPDGTVCVIRISKGAPELTIQTPHPSARPNVGPLVDELVRLLPPL
jgi:hypothetical protein